MHGIFLWAELQFYELTVCSVESNGIGQIFERINNAPKMIKRNRYNTHVLPNHGEKVKVSASSPVNRMSLGNLLNHDLRFDSHRAEHWSAHQKGKHTHTYTNCAESGNITTQCLRNGFSFRPTARLRPLFLPTTWHSYSLKWFESRGILFNRLWSCSVKALN